MNRDQVFNFSFQVMGSPCSMQFYADSEQRAESVKQLAIDRIAQPEGRYSRYRVVAGSVATIAMLKANTGLRWLQACGLAFLGCQSNGHIFNRLQKVKK